MDKELVKKFADKYPEINELLEKHQEMENQVAELSQKPYLTPEEEVKLKELKKEKLYIKEKIYKIIKTKEGIEID
ncbi:MULTISPECIES: DUF465 domain-containing protein [Thermodesulfobacterium]|jgi:uncharacterized protein YdcH (DUF465 family)|uniref:DUF465 domain-containing protein n=2 Tax=Thermodesulfobacterium commune TaxID=1741 RepID=A0A075WZY0_9BACT|nr:MULTISPECIES: DUF465 domain-containing protein [Thermodesulfobacterium]KUJ97392.1 MAG: Uncharacterized protein XD42_0949 [Thermodesulfobacterium sp. 37_54]KUK38079.1 MAG: Uncharacterized protein XD67_0603 [Thermodesulfobacterium commune]AIH04272.1 hypothetical protein HL41_05650 [Thermodesulfobacterium commune DSM 2178]MBZ4681470.1 hypothetical protein [Thermodesulfobacterium sp.]MDK2861613.1 uncharacterized protein [Thermodesulfobacterium sp.]